MANARRRSTRGMPAIPWWPHPGVLSYRRAVAIQRQLALRVIPSNDSRPIRYVAGLDAAFSSDGRDCLAAAVLWDLRLAAVCGQSLAVRRVRMPYIPVC
jgi:deoxyinosine 3'endonuclease (endonuclease V)